jgi:hypothetical protein
MDAQAFEAELAQLIGKHGAHLTAPIEMRLAGAGGNEAFIPRGGKHENGATCAVRAAQEIELHITVRAKTVGDWHHESGDDRRLHPDLRANNNSTER